MSIEALLIVDDGDVDDDDEDDCKRI